MREIFLMSGYEDTVDEYQTICYNRITITTGN
jgi:hypothetical protein